MPFGVTNPLKQQGIAPPCINSVAGGAEGSFLKKRITKETCELFPHQESFINLKSFIEACATSCEGKPMPEKKAVAVVADSNNATAATAGSGAGASSSSTAAPPSSSVMASAASAAAATANLCPNSPLYPFLRLLTDVLIPTLHGYVDVIPLQDMKAQRFGNKAFRDFCQKISDELLELVVKKELMPVIEALAKKFSDEKKKKAGGGESAAAASSSSTESVVPSFVANELYEYLLDSFGNAQRIDFGTGHEMHFMCFFYTAVVRIGAPKTKEEGDKADDEEASFKRSLSDFALVVFPEYLRFVRRLQHHYSLEPAGSHGVWGLDDYHHLPFLFGASQLVGHEPAILPKHITERPRVDANRSRYLYFEMIGWILDNKKGPFHEHSPILYNVSGIDEWSRIRGGMLKMYVAEVMSRFAVVQHFLFGETLQWKA